MNMEHIEYANTRGLSEREVDERLREHGIGVLALADGGRAYAIPVDYHYDGESLLLRLSDDGHSRKLSYVETTVDPEFLVYGHDGPHDSWSVLVTGAIREVDPEDRGIDAATVNDWFGPLRLFDEAVEDVEIRLFEFETETVVGRATIG
jgi:nitroimidazol reductase NimA-like FMN-containing flavoprotein (pyridoxamine 5'-phosphate oxidase superfamily)